MSVYPDTSEQVSYASATTHYSSPRRRDAVKRLYEEPITASNAAAALARIQKEGALSVVDLGCGTGDGLSILSGRQSTPPFFYHGVDADSAMIDAARTQHAAAGTFSVGDIRELAPELPDVYLSFGVPFSHLTPPELVQFLTDLGELVVQQRKKVVLVIDVLGRYSVEWHEHWPEQRWRYPMTFFEDAVNPPTCDMTFHTPGSVLTAVDAAERATGARFQDPIFVDRSPLVGRHTTTSLISPDTPTYRKHLNTVLEGHRVDRGDLELQHRSVPNAQAQNAYDQLRGLWTTVLDGHDFASAPGTEWTHLGLHLLAALTTSPSAGIGHTLIATFTVAP